MFIASAPGLIQGIFFVQDEELEECRINAQKKLKALEQQLESEHEVSI